VGLLLLIGSFAVTYGIPFAAAAWATADLWGMEALIALFVAIASLFAYAVAQGHQQWLDTRKLPRQADSSIGDFSADDVGPETRQRTLERSGFSGQ
jgi:membrane protein implicated in regulation of membrane protease activity